MDCFQRHGKLATSSGTEEEDQLSKTALGSDASPTQIAVHAQTKSDATTLADQYIESDATEAALPMLPKGFVGNTAEIYAEVASFDVIPTDKLCKYWRVYTVTHRNLYDPTSNRLENFWWHIWGSRLQQLSGKTVARLYKHISTAPTFVPLRTPLSRYDGPTIKCFQPISSSRRVQDETAQQNISDTNVNTEKHDLASAKSPSTLASSDHCGTTKSSTHKLVNNLEGKDLQTNTQNPKTALSYMKDTQTQSGFLPSSSSRPVTTSSILRKQKSMSSGLRPTPRFALPFKEAKAGGGTEESPERNADKEKNLPIPEPDKDTKNGKSDEIESKPAKAPTLDIRAKPSAGKRDVSKRVNVKASKKKIVVSVAASKRKTVVSKRFGAQRSQYLEASEDLASRAKRSPYLLPNRSEESLLDVGEDDDEFQATVVDSPACPGSQSSTTRTIGQRSRSQPPAILDNSSGKRPARTLSFVQQVPEILPVPDDTAVESASLPAVSTTGTDMPRSVPAKITGETPLSRPYYYIGSSTELRSPAANDSLPDSKNFAAMHYGQPAQQSNLIKMRTATTRPGGGLVRQTTLPYDMGQGHRQQLARVGSPTVAPMSVGLSPAPPIRAYQGPGPGSGTAQALSAARISAPQMMRSMSQDSYVVQSRVGYRSPILGPMRSPTIAAPSMVAASGIFLDGEGPDPFELYARTGLDQSLEDLEDRELAPHMPQSRSYGTTFQGPSSFHYSSSFQRPSSFTDSQPVNQKPIFAPTRPTSTPRIPFARTRSQLNVILGREKERLGENNYASWQESRGAKDHDDHNRGQKLRESP